MKKYMLLSLLIASPIFSEEPYFQQQEQTGYISILGKINSSFLFNNNLEGLEWLGGMSLEGLGRWTKPNFFGTFKVKGIFPFSSNKLLMSPDFIIYAGIGGFLLDKRNELGIGSFMTMSFNAFFYPFTTKIGMGVSLDTRYSYSFHKLSAFTVGLDIEYKLFDIDENDNNSGFQIFGIGLVFGFTFNAY